MTNKITATIEFHFKGKHFTPSTVLNLDEIMTKHGNLPDLHSLLAKLHNIDMYSYEYEMMLAEDIQFSDAEGWVVEFTNTSQFDQALFKQQWHDRNTLDKLAATIKQQLDIDDINQHPKLKSVLISAYKLGKKNKNG